MVTRLTIPAGPSGQAPGHAGVTWQSRRGRGAAAPVRLTTYRGTAVSLQDMAGLTIGKLASGEGVGVETVRFYQRRGLLALPGRAGSGFREYTEDDRQRLAFIRRARQLGFSLGEIGDLLGAGDGRSAGDVIRAAEAKLVTLRSKAALLREFGEFF